ncbi:polysaccharide pyruvyl transferase family protein [Pseudoalteromonas sp. OOF1S-7]|uniref:polysaccharide pyruvyl transferase family protein n=1 Tax=Pseudoalteromonas sp. OOF1S-7 TaxID=2917757 RepID=UPI001EF45DFF|nr:polysaccharide pyruvyl transferase family protein [Pseudoalteromonas sp. OOF1S-7]MCG7536347.1 polysaccharide pyruvyl transferase family protein [Pseudoalteromonas sp. OOF1S-7]
MKKLNVLHVASFTGNIGDNANHLGFRRWFESVAQVEVQWTEQEIREFYWKNREWDSEFVEFANSFDLLIIGGGNYFELWVDKSPTGTSIEIPLELYKKINTPVYFNALGVDPGQGATESSVGKFRAFIEAIVASKGLITVRNDGALANVRNHVGEDVLAHFHEAPDGGFFINDCIASERDENNKRKVIGINVASDMPEVRFKGFENGLEDFCVEFAKSMVTISESLGGCDFVFFPHIFRDLDVINKIINHLPDELRRKDLTVFEYSTGDRAAYNTFGAYTKCDLILGSRFHSNVCALSLGVESIGLLNYMQIENLYKGLSLEDRLVDVRIPGFSAQLEAKALAVLAGEAQPADNRSKEIVSDMRARTEVVLRSWLAENI